MASSVRIYMTNAVISFIPDVLISWVVAMLTDSGWRGFLISFVALQALYLLLWAKRTAWGWLQFWAYGRQEMASHLENQFIEKRFPPPDRHTGDVEDYLRNISNNEAGESGMRLKAAYDLGCFEGMRASRNFQLVLMLQSAAKIALNRHARHGARDLVRN
jgi:type II secretory pathway component PulL